MTIQVEQVKLERTPRREAREAYARFLLNKADVTPEDMEIFLNQKQAVLFDNSPIELIYTGRYELAVDAVEKFVESLNLEDL